MLEELRARPELVERARRRVEEWAASGSVARPYVDAWRELLALPLDELERRILDRGDRAHDLRQVSHFRAAQT